MYIWQPFEARIIETVGNVLCNRRGTSLESAEKFSSPRMISLLRLVCFEPRLDPGLKLKLFWFAVLNPRFALCVDQVTQKIKFSAEKGHECNFRIRGQIFSSSHIFLSQNCQCYLLNVSHLGNPYSNVPNAFEMIFWVMKGFWVLMRRSAAHMDSRLFWDKRKREKSGNPGYLYRFLWTLHSGSKLANLKKMGRKCYVGAVIGLY